MTDRVPHLEEILDPLTGVRVGSRHLYRVDHHSEPEREEECRRQGGRCAHVASASAERSGAAPEGPATAPGAGEARRRIECASCHKAPTDDPSIALVRANVKGVPGVFLCQWCAGPPAAGSREARLEAALRVACPFMDATTSSVEFGDHTVWTRQRAREAVYAALAPAPEPRPQDGPTPA